MHKIFIFILMFDRIYIQTLSCMSRTTLSIDCSSQYQSLLDWRQRTSFILHLGKTFLKQIWYAIYVTLYHWEAFLYQLEFLFIIEVQELELESRLEQLK